MNKNKMEKIIKQLQLELDLLKIELNYLKIKVRINGCK